MAVPKFYELFNPVMEALKNLGGSASISEIVDETARVLDLSEEDLNQTEPNKSRTVFEYRSAWARSYLKDYGAITNSSRGIWSITEDGQKMSDLDPDEVKRVARLNSKKRKQAKELNSSDLDQDNGDEQDVEDWKNDLLEVLQTMPPDRFERLCQRMLRESGFTKVQVTGKAGDGGIDGVGTVRLGGLLSFPIIFQCKRYKGSVGPQYIRDFRGAMVGRADRGLIMTTGTFTRDSKLEATRDGAPPIDLVDGDLLVDKLKELQLGVNITLVEQVEIDKHWFDQI